MTGLMPNFVEFPRGGSRGDPVFTLQARGLLSLNHAAFLALGEPAAVALLYDPDGAVVGLRKVDKAYENAYQVRKQGKSPSYLVGAQGFVAYHRIPIVRARRFVGKDYGGGVWGFGLREGEEVKNRRGAPEPEPAVTSCWRHTTNGFDVAGLMRIDHVGMSHPGYTRRQPQDRPPSMRVGILVACEPLGPAPPTTELRGRFMSLLVQQEVMELISRLGDIGKDARWRPWGGHGRINMEAALASENEDEAPVASALLLLPEVGMSAYGRDTRYAELVLDIELRDANGDPAPAMTLPVLHDRFVRALALPEALAGFLTQSLGLATADDPPSQAGVWLKTPRSMTEVVDTEGFKSLPGSPASNWFAGWAIADPGGQPAELAAVEMLRQMCDYTLHLDGYEPVLDSLSK